MTYFLVLLAGMLFPVSTTPPEVLKTHALVMTPVPVVEEIPEVVLTTKEFPNPSKEMSVNERIDEIATLYNVSPALMKKIVWCESRNFERAVGDGGNSFGLVQIHLPSHPKITKEQAFDPDFALSFLAYHLSKGEGYLWTCFSKL